MNNDHCIRIFEEIIKDNKENWTKTEQKAIWRELGHEH